MTVLSVALIGGVSVSKRAYDQSEVKYLVQVGIADEKVTVLRTSDQKYADRVRTAIGNAIAS